MRVAIKKKNQSVLLLLFLVNLESNVGASYRFIPSHANENLELKYRSSSIVLGYSTITCGGKFWEMFPESKRKHGL